MMEKERTREKRADVSAESVTLGWRHSGPRRTPELTCGSSLMSPLRGHGGGVASVSGVLGGRSLGDAGETVGTDADSGVVHPCGRERQRLLRYPQKLREVGTIPLQSFQKEPSVMTP